MNLTGKRFFIAANLVAVSSLLSACPPECQDNYDCLHLSSGDKRYACVDNKCTPAVSLSIGGGTGGGAGGEDAGSEDAGSEDAGSEDAGSEDAGSEDAGSEDAGSEDAGSEDAGSEDAGSEDAGSDAEDGGVGKMAHRLPLPQPQVSLLTRKMP